MGFKLLSVISLSLAVRDIMLSDPLQGSIRYDHDLFRGGKYQYQRRLLVANEYFLERCHVETIAHRE